MHKFDGIFIFVCGLLLLLSGWRTSSPPPQTYQLIELNSNNCLAYRPEVIHKSYIYDRTQRQIIPKYTSVECQWPNELSCKDELHPSVNHQVSRILPILPTQTQILYKLKNGTYGILTPDDSIFYAFQNQTQFLHVYSRFLNNQTACF